MAWDCRRNPENKFPNQENRVGENKIDFSPDFDRFFISFAYIADL